MSHRSPTTIVLHRARLVFVLTALLPTVLMTAIGVVLVATGSRSVHVVGGILVLSFCAMALTGYTLGTVFVTRGAALASVQNEFLASVSHELRTPLTSIRMFIDTLQEGRIQDVAEQRRCLTIIDQELARLDGLVDKLIALSKIESRHAAFERRLVPVPEIVDQALKAFRAMAVEGGADLRVEVEPNLTVRGDREALAQALANLLSNAWKYTPSTGKRIEITARGEATSVVLTVADNGIGVPRSEQELIFEKFQRGAAVLQSGVEGTGLGLSIVRAIARAHRGKVDVRSEGGQGARFRMVLPRVRVTA